MTKLDKFFIIITLLVIMLILLSNQKVFASNTDLFQKVEYSEDFKKWLELSEEEKKNVIMPRMYEVENINITSKNPLYRATMLKASINSRYNLKDVIPNNVVIKNQQQTGTCWAFASLSSLETNLALSNYKKGINLSKIYDFSERHMEYATSKTFLNNIENTIGYNRQIGTGGTYQVSSSYLTNGSGAIPESEMPFENNENIIDISQIQNKTVSSQVYDTVLFPNYLYETNENKTNIINQIKQHIQNYGSVQASIHASYSNCYNNATRAQFCNDSTLHPIDHGVSIIGWDDNYSIDNFTEEAKPTSNGAWIIRNSWGEDLENGNNGLIYISYEDVNISSNLFGIVKATDAVNYDYIYQYDELFPVNQVSLNNSNIMLCNIFNKKTEGTEYLTQVSLYAPETYTCKVYVNPNGASTSKNDLQLVSLKAGESETFNIGYHTLEFSKPIEIKANSFAIVVEIQSTHSTVMLPLEGKINSYLDWWDSVKVENGKCFVALGNNLENCEWFDLSKLTEQYPDLANGDSSIKAFTTTELFDDSLKNIEITTPPTKTSYFEGENFDKTGMVVKANYNSKTNPSIILDSSSYSITNGTNLKAGQTSVLITYEDKSVNQTITVEKNSVVELKIKTPPNKTEYKEGQQFDKTGMVIEAIYKDGTAKAISDYIVENGNNLKANQTQVTISYEEITIEQPITVRPNPIMEIKVTKAPNKTKYVVGQNFDKTGMIITGTYQDETTQEILDYIIEDGTNLSNEQISVTIRYGEKTTTQAITVEEKTITEIRVNKQPSKLAYLQNKENLDLVNGSLTVIYNDESTEIIAINSEEVKITGFDNTKPGKNTITVTYQEKTTQFEVTIIEEEKAKNSNLNNAKCDVKKVQAYYFTDDSKNDYVLIDVEINEIAINLINDKVNYYYYLSSNEDEQNINNWTKISETQNFNNKLQFTIDSRNVSNYNEISSEDVLFLYIKEVAIKGGDQSVSISKAIKLETDNNIETHVNNVKKEIAQSANLATSNSLDRTMASGKLPNAGIKITIIALILIMLGIGICLYVKYKNLSKYIK